MCANSPCSLLWISLMIMMISSLSGLDGQDVGTDAVSPTSKVDLQDKEPAILDQ